MGEISVSLPAIIEAWKSGLPTAEHLRLLMQAHQAGSLPNIAAGMAQGGENLMDSLRVPRPTGSRVDFSKGELGLTFGPPPVKGKGKDKKKDPGTVSGATPVKGWMGVPYKAPAQDPVTKPLSNPVPDYSNPKLTSPLNKAPEGWKGVPYLPPGEPQSLPTNPIGEQMMGTLHEPISPGVTPEEKIDIRGVGNQGPPTPERMDPYEQYGLMLASQIAGPRGGVFSNQLAQRQSQIFAGNESRTQDWRQRQAEDRLEEDRIAAEQRAIESQRVLQEQEQALRQKDPLYKAQLFNLQMEPGLKYAGLQSDLLWKNLMMQDRLADNQRAMMLGAAGIASRNPFNMMGDQGDFINQILLSQIGMGQPQEPQFNAARLPQSAVAKINEALQKPDLQSKLAALGVIEKAATAAGDSATQTEVQRLMSPLKSQLNR